MWKSKVHYQQRADVHTLPCNGQQTRHHTVQVLRKRAKAGHDQTRIIHAKQN